MEIRPINKKELCLSGVFGRKINEYLKKGYKSYSPLYKSSYEFDGFDINIDEKNFMEFYGFSSSAESTMLEKFNNYIYNLVKKVQDEKYIENIITICNLDLSRKSSYHIFNIELLVSCAQRKKSHFCLLYQLMQDRDFYQFALDDYEFYLFSIFDTDDLIAAEKILETIVEEISLKINEDYGYVYYRNKYDSANSSLKKRISEYVGEEIAKKIDENLQLVKIK